MALKSINDSWKYTYKFTEIWAGFLWLSSNNICFRKLWSCIWCSCVWVTANHAFSGLTFFCCSFILLQYHRQIEQFGDCPLKRIRKITCLFLFPYAFHLLCWQLNQCVWAGGTEWAGCCWQKWCATRQCLKKSQRALSNCWGLLGCGVRDAVT